jgi:hypothetical protein
MRRTNLARYEIAMLTSVAAVDPHYAWAIGEGDAYPTHHTNTSFIEMVGTIAWQQLPSRVLWA